MAKPIDLPQGSLEMLILKATSLGPLHGYGILLRIQQISGKRLEILQGTFYTAIYRLERRGVQAGCGLSAPLQQAPFLVEQGLVHKSQCRIGILLPPQYEYENAL